MKVNTTVDVDCQEQLNTSNKKNIEANTLVYKKDQSQILSLVEQTIDEILQHEANELFTEHHLNNNSISNNQNQKVSSLPMMQDQ